MICECIAKENDMNNNDLVNEICNTLFGLEYEDISFGNSSKFPIIYRRNYGLVRNVVKEIINNNYIENILVMETKIKVYEEIIGKSNFAPMVQKAVE
jgi:hypothetical protein